MNNKPIVEIDINEPNVEASSLRLKTLAPESDWITISVSPVPEKPGTRNLAMAASVSDEVVAAVLLDVLTAVFKRIHVPMNKNYPKESQQ